MVRVNLIDYNDTDFDRPLNFKNMGNLTKPINADYVSVIRFSLPTGSLPIFLMSEDYVNQPYTFTLSYQVQSASQYMILENRGTQNRIYSVEHIVSMMNTALQTAFNQLALQIGLPTTDAPYVIYDCLTSLFSIISNKNAYDTRLPVPIFIRCNRNLMRFFQGMPSTWDETTNISTLIIETGRFNQNLYPLNNTFIQTTQEAPSTPNWSLVRIVYVNTSLPIESEVFTSSSINTGQLNSNILSSYVIPVERGTSDDRTSLNFTAPEDRFRPCKLMGKNLYDIKCDIRYQDVEGQDQYFFIGARSIANIELEFF
jgi:hypothetical protein